MDANDLLRASQARPPYTVHGHTVERITSQSPLHRGTRHGLTFEPPYTVHGHVVERIRFDGKLVGHRIDGELMATNLRHQTWLEQVSIPSSQGVSIPSSQG